MKTSNVKNPVGRPSKFEDSLIRHLVKMYSNKQFTSKDLINSFRLQLQGRKSSEQIIIGMALKKLSKKNYVKVVGEQETGKRGVNNKVYSLNKTVVG